MSQDKQLGEKVSFKDTLNLPKTEFPIRPNHKEDDAKLLVRWATEDIYKKTFNLNNGSEKYVLHDGPPYANGNIHIGHAYNKILKDILTKYQRMLGKHVPVTPGWDCHGLPIEFKVTQEHKGLSRTELLKECRQTAEKWINVQRTEFKALGVFMDWEHPYITMDFKYEAYIMRAFGDFVKLGYIEKKNKTVAWCAHCQTVLAEAEKEYHERKDPSIFVKFPLLDLDVKRLFPLLEGQEVSFLVWTTTPWTLPLNRAVLLKTGAKYQIIKNGDSYLIIGAPLADKICGFLEIQKEVVAELDAEQFLNAKVLHPFDESYVPVLLENWVSLEDGTAAVHCAPGCGPEDYEVGLKNKLEIFSPVGPDGRYTKGIKPEELIGMSVNDAQGWVITKLLENKRLAYKTSIRHSYPHCWRCRNGLIFRATSQWFCNLSKNNLQERAVKAIEYIIEFVPKNSANSLKAAVEGRLEWCLSRQRVWGVPIPAILCKSCGYAFLTTEIVNKVAQGVEKEGVEYWNKVDLKDLLAENIICPECKASDWQKELDILDVWFDSGVSHFAVLKQNKNLAYPADVYLEGRDQARGWFQSSLLTSLVLEESPSMKSIITHGYTVDEKGQKMSKSLGNVVAPKDIIDLAGTDGLRLWASSIDFVDDAVISKQLLTNVQEVYRKIRNTCRFLISNLYDFDIKKDALNLDKLMFIDKYAVHDLININKEILNAYSESKFTAVFHLLGDYCTKNLSAFYLDVIKDRLYVDKADGASRRSAQTACWYILDTLTHLMAPIMSFTAELVSDAYQKDKEESIHLQKFAFINDLYSELNLNVDQEEFNELWQLLFNLRSAMLKAIELKREVGLIKHPLEASVIVYFDLSDKKLSKLLDLIKINQAFSGKTVEEFFSEFIVVSNFVVADSADMLQPSEYKNMQIFVDRAKGQKCPRCWRYQESSDKDGLCDRCLMVLKS